VIFLEKKVKSKKQNADLNFIQKYKKMKYFGFFKKVFFYK